MELPATDRCQIFINRNLHCIVPTVKTKQQQNTQQKDVERETHLGSLEEEDKQQNINNLPTPQFKHLAYLSGLEQCNTLLIYWQKYNHCWCWVRVFIHA